MCLHSQLYKGRLICSMYKKKIRIWVIINILLAMIVVVEIWIMAGTDSDVQEQAAVSEEQVQKVNEKEEKLTETPVSTPEVTQPPEETVMPEATLTPPKKSSESENLSEETAVELGELNTILSDQISGYSETVSVYVKDLLGGGTVQIIGGSQQKAASLIKLYVMASVYEQIQRGNLTEDEEIQTLLRNMITVSDNESTNEVVRRLSPDGTNWQEGSEVTNAYISQNGYQDTFMGRDVRDYREVPAEGENYTSVTDCGRILEAIYRGNCISPEYSAKMLELLKQQQRRWKIPQGVEQALYVANKTGELEDSQHDAAIIQLDSAHAYILCVMTSNVTDGEAAQNDIVSISRTVYQYFYNRL